MDDTFVTILKQHIDLFAVLIGLLSSGIYYGHNVLYKIHHLLELTTGISKEVKELKEFRNNTKERLARIESNNDQLKETQNRILGYFEKFILTK